MNKYKMKKAAEAVRYYRPAHEFPPAELFDIESVIKSGKFWGEYEFDDYEIPAKVLQNQM